ncbi:acetate--CoA ligase family protein [Nocardioides sp. Bht2]|uniref:acetate--CoA ligase family protein n=1 Tax=Nocardioides sp. Bht2 TaxID=3392297 RepID=UPI0039B5AE92
MAVEVGDSGQRMMVPEHAVKSFLREQGIRCPRGISVSDDEVATTAFAELREPLVVKAFGPGLVHKSDVGAVSLDVGRSDLEASIAKMRVRLDGAGVPAAGFLVEEQVPKGAELLLGIVRRDPFGLLVVFGVGGTMTEIADRTVSRMYPLSRKDATEMVRALPAGVRAGSRTGVPIDEQSLVEFLVAMAGPQGVIGGVEELVDEFECNPIIARGADFHVVDARMILTVTDEVRAATAPSTTDFGPLFSPRAVAVAGASSTRLAFGNRFLAAYKAAGWTEGLYAVHPTADEVDGVPAVRSVSEVAGGVDYLLSAVAATATPGLVRESGEHARFIQVTASGFSEIGNDHLTDALVDAASGSDVRVLGPNCMGVFSPAGRQSFLLNTPTQGGPVSVISQSGSLASEIVLSGAARGLGLGKLVTVGNAVDVSTGELLAWLADDEDTEVIGLYVEGVSDDHFMTTLRRLQGRKQVVVLVGGLSVQGARAVASHTGAMAGEDRVWAALADSLGVTVVRSLEDFLAALTYAEVDARRRALAPSSAGAVGALVVGPGGGASVLATDAFDARGVALTPLTPEPRAALASLGYGAGTSVANPVEIPIGPGAPATAFESLLAQVTAHQVFADIVMHINVQSWYAFGGGGIGNLLEVVESAGRVASAGARVGVVVRSLDAARADHGTLIREACVAAGLPLFRDFDEAAVAVAAAQRFDQARRGDS